MSNIFIRRNKKPITKRALFAVYTSVCHSFDYPQFVSLFHWVKKLGHH